MSTFPSVYFIAFTLLDSFVTIADFNVRLTYFTQQPYNCPATKVNLGRSINFKLSVVAGPRAIAFVQSDVIFLAQAYKPKS